MTLIMCDKCAGKGLIGMGANPILLEGITRKCDACLGTGKVEQADVAPVAPVPEQGAPTKPATVPEGSIPSDGATDGAAESEKVPE